MQTPSKLIGGVLLVSGTTIGAGMLALPIMTGLAGFFPSVFLLVFFWVVMTYTAFLILEVNSSAPQGNVNMISMAKSTLGKPGEIVSWLTYLFLLYSLTTAYMAGGSPLVLEMLTGLTGLILPQWVGIVPLLLIFGYAVYRGTRSADLLNRLLMIGLGLSYLLLVGYVFPKVEPPFLAYKSWSSLVFCVSIIATSFGFHIIIPTLMHYFGGNIRAAKSAILIGSLIPLICYILWQLLALGTIPLEGDLSLRWGYENGVNGAYLLSQRLEETALHLAAKGFSLFAIVTSFLGVTMSLSDFLADGLKIKKTGAGKWGIYCLTFIPPFLITLYDPRAFLNALDYAGAFGVMILLALLPALMVWRGRYHLAYETAYRAPGEKKALLFIIVFSLLVMGLEMGFKLGII